MDPAYSAHRARASSAAFIDRCPAIELSFEHPPAPATNHQLPNHYALHGYVKAVSAKNESYTSGRPITSSTR
eukprot:6183397-Pleurochrysis_carterae.AAC.5